MKSRMIKSTVKGGIWRCDLDEEFHFYIITNYADSAATRKRYTYRDAMDCYRRMVTERRYCAV